MELYLLFADETDALHVFAPCSDAPLLADTYLEIVGATIRAALSI